MSQPSMRPKTAIHDRAGEGAKQRDPGIGEHRVCRSALAFAGADKALREHRGARAGDDYDAKVATWRSSYQELLKTAASYDGGPNAADQD